MGVQLYGRIHPVFGADGFNRSVGYRYIRMISSQLTDSAAVISTLTILRITGVLAGSEVFIKASADTSIIGLTLCTTVIVVGRVLFLQRRVVVVIGRQHAQMFTSIASMFIESGAMFGHWAGLYGLRCDQQ